MEPKIRNCMESVRANGTQDIEANVITDMTVEATGLHNLWSTTEAN